ncbi:MAG: permease-like cell division protein FtsX [Coxiellaceae bacterium]|jgi:cell division transport system permease protein|nr:permease-like cell division protein FtsX [Coxiellaceae bacterium]
MLKIFKFNQTPDYLSAITTGLKQIFRTPFTSFIIILLMTLALFLVITFYILRQNIGPLTEKWNESTEISLYLKKKVNLQEAKTLLEKLQLHPLVTKAELIPSTEGIKTFTENTILKTLLSNFKENPLPNVITVYPQVKMLTHNITTEFIKELNNISEVDTVKADTEWIECGHKWLDLLSNLSRFFTFLLSLNILLIIGGTSYIYAKIVTLKNNINKIIPQYQCAWLSLISNLLALLLTQIILTILQDHGINLVRLAVSCGVSIFLISIFLSFFSAKIGASN